MAIADGKFSNFLEYFGVQPRNFKHPLESCKYNSDDILPYYLDKRPFAGHQGAFDNRGLPLYTHGDRNYLLPVQVCLNGLGHLQLFGDTKSEEELNRFKIAVDGLVADQTDSGCWLTDLPKKHFNLSSSFPSAMAQGLAISCLVRAAHQFGDDQYRQVAVHGLKPFHVEVREGGVTSYHDAGPFYEEYPCYPHRHVLNGFLFSMWGLFDLMRTDDNNEARLLWNSGLTTIMKWLDRFDMGYWSRYQLPSRPSNPATVAYHRLHINQLGVMFALTGKSLFNDYRLRWLGYLDRPLNALRTLPAKLRWLM